METKELKITPPEGYEIDRENSTFECIKFKKKVFSYEDVERELFIDNIAYFIDSCGNIISCNPVLGTCIYANTGISKKQLKKLLAINKLMNVAKYLNGDWKPDWNDDDEKKWYIWLGFNKEPRILGFNKKPRIVDIETINSMLVYFKSRELAQQAIDILGEDTIRLALSTDW